MKIVRYTAEGESIRTGLIVSDTIVDVCENSVEEVIREWASFEPSFNRAAERSDGVPYNATLVKAPITRPGKVFAIGLNYADHIAESDMKPPEHQVWFTKAQTSLTGPFDPIQIPRVSQYVDYEAELVAVIGKTCKNVSEADAADVVFGYCVGNDVTERLWQHRTPQWSLGKSFDTHGPIGPWITTADAVADPHNLELSCTVNGEKRQSSNTKNMIFNVWEQIEHLSSAMTLEPGDLIFTGTPEGVGAAMDPRKFLESGDVVRCEVQGLGSIEATCESEA